MQCKSLWIKASAKCINVNVNVNVNIDAVNESGPLLFKLDRLIEQSHITFSMRIYTVNVFPS